MTTNFEVRVLLESRIDFLYQQMDEIISNYWKQVILMEKKRPGLKNRCRLKLRCLKTGNSIRAEWVGVSWVLKNKEGKLFDKLAHITKPARSFGYTLTKLYKYSHEWEKPIVEETEFKLVRFRQEAHHLTRALVSLGFAEEIEIKRSKELAGKFPSDECLDDEFFVIGEDCWVEDPRINW